MQNLRTSIETIVRWLRSRPRIIKNILKNVAQFINTAFQWVCSRPQFIKDTVRQFARNVGAWLMNAILKTVKVVLFGVKIAGYLLLGVLAIASLGYCLKIYLARRHERLQQLAASQQRLRDAELNLEREQRYQERIRQQQIQREEQTRLREMREQAQRVKEQREAEELRQKKAQEARRSAALNKFQYDDWRVRCDKFFANRETAKSFPHPPYSDPCSQVCKQNLVLKACKHSMKRLYAASGRELGALLKEERIAWHPDKMSRCLLERRKEFQEKASEMFKLIGILLEEEARA